MSVIGYVGIWVYGVCAGIVDRIKELLPKIDVNIDGKGKSAEDSGNGVKESGGEEDPAAG